MNPCAHDTQKKIGKQHGFELWRCEGCSSYFATRPHGGLVERFEVHEYGKWIRWEAGGLRYFCIHPASVQID